MPVFQMARWTMIARRTTGIALRWRGDHTCTRGTIRVVDASAASSGEVLVRPRGAGSFRGQFRHHLRRLDNRHWWFGWRWRHPGEDRAVEKVVLPFVRFVPVNGMIRR